MVKGTNLGLLPEDHPIFSMPLYIGTVKTLSDFMRDLKRNTDKDTRKTPPEVESEDENE